MLRRLFFFVRKPRKKIDALWKTALNVSISADDKPFLKMYALELDIAVAFLIEGYMEKLSKEHKQSAEYYQFACEGKN